MDNALGFEDVLDVFDSMSGLDDGIPGEDTASQNIIMESLFAGRRFELEWIWLQCLLVSHCLLYRLIYVVVGTLLNFGELFKVVTVKF